MTDRLGIEHQTVLGLPPVEFVNLAADLQCRYIAIVLSTRPYNPHGYEPYSLIEDGELRRRMITAMRERDVSVFLGEGFVVYPDTDVRRYEADLDVMAELGASKVNLVSFDPDLDRTFDAFAELAVAAAGNTPADLAALDPGLIRHVQLSDNTIRQRGAVYRDDTIDRSVPGEGELPLAEMLAARALMADLGQP